MTIKKQNNNKINNTKDKNKDKSKIPFERQLYLFKYFLSLFDVDSITNDRIKILNSLDYEELSDENGQTKFYNYLYDIINKEYKSKFKGYDDNIIEYIEQINKKRKLKISLKYFQYLSILFTEIYLDKYYNNKTGLIDELNKCAKSITNQINTKYQTNYSIEKVYDEENLNKLAYMCATGSGKTIILHINILQMMKYNKNFSNYSNVLLLTKNETLSKQHKEELDLSSIKSNIFNGNYSDSIIQIIDINKFKEKDGPGSFDYRNFGESNLLFVDEGHSGASGNVWYEYRNNLVAINGFTFEYSATFKEAVSDKEVLKNEYQRAIIFDYQYLFFRNDGYGKDYQILNLEKALDEKDNDLYLTGCLLTYFEQLIYYIKKENEIKDFMIEKPLMVFVGTTVTGRKQDNVDNTDVEKVILFLEDFVKNNNNETIKNIVKILKAKTGITEINRLIENKDLFKNKLSVLKELYSYDDEKAKETAEKIYDDVLHFVFNYYRATDVPHLILTKVQGDEGEIGIRVGNSDNEFAVITVGDVDGLLKLLKDKKLIVNSNIKSEKSLFGTIGNKDSGVNILVGSKKFIEGWNNYRVSTMGLIRFAQSQGVEAIQLFGRGVRLKGYNNSLKRSACLDKVYKDNLNIPKDMRIVETLNIFGLSSDYMAEFKKFLDENGLDSSNKEIVTKKVSVVKTFNNLKDKHLKILKIKKGLKFEKDAESFIFNIKQVNGFNDYIKKDLNKIKKSYMNKVNIKLSNNEVEVGSDDLSNSYHLTDFSINGQKVIFNNNVEYNYVDYDSIYFDLVNYKKLKKYNKIIIERDEIKQMLLDDNWYNIVIDKDKLEIDGNEDLDRAMRISCDLLRTLLDKFYKYMIKMWESKNLEYSDIDDSDDNIISEYEFSFENNENAINNQIENKIDSYIKTIKQKINNIEGVIDIIKDKGNVNIKEKDIVKESSFTKELCAPGISNCFAILCPEHFYEPLYSLGEKQGYSFSIKPIALNIDEKKFVELLIKYKYSRDDNNINYFDKFLEENTEAIGTNAEIYLLRNMPKKGIGFFEANNFYPDFILWIDTDTTQYINFIDPKGIMHLVHNPQKYKFCSNEKDGEYFTIKDLQSKLSKQFTGNDKKIVLNAFILSNTNKSELSKEEKELFDKCNIIYMYDDNKERDMQCIIDMFDKIVAE